MKTAQAAIAEVQESIVEVKYWRRLVLAFWRQFG